MTLTRPDASQVDGLTAVAYVTTFGAVGDGVTDDTAAINAASADIAAQGGGVVYFPPGRYLRQKASGSLHARDNITFRGAGMNASIIVFDDNDTDARADLFKDEDTAGSNEYFELSDIGIEGSDVDFPSETNASIALSLNNYDRVILRNVRFQNLRNIAATCYDSGTFQALGCELDRVRRGGLRFSMSRNAVVTGCVFRKVCDDVVQGHSWADPDADAGDGGISVVGNTIEFSQGMKFLSGRNLVIAGNTFRRMTRRAINVEVSASTNPEGVRAVHSVVIDGNTITDTFGSLGTQDVIRVGLDVVPDVALAEAPEAYLADDDMHNPTSTVFPPFAIQITNNTIARTLPIVASYADYGFGEWYDRVQLTAPTIDALTFNAYPIRMVYGGHAVNISGNVISNGGERDGIQLFIDDTSPARSFNCVLISDNVIRDVRRGVVVGTSTLATTQDVHVTGNIIDCDPYCRNHNADGTWNDAASTADVGVYAPNVAGMVIERNTFRNVHTPVTHGGAVVRDNKYFCGFDAAGSAAANLGIRVLPSSFDEGIVIHTNSNPNSASYGAIVTNPVLRAAAMPATGRYHADHFVHNTSKAVLGAASSQYILNGWRRITTGEAHVAGVDWVEVRTLTGT